jgi:hypothetical protein
MEVKVQTPRGIHAHASVSSAAAEAVFTFKAFDSLPKFEPSGFYRHFSGSSVKLLEVKRAQ